VFFFLGRKGLSIVETLLALCLMGIFVGIVVFQYQRVTREARETAVKTELTNIRTSMQLFKMLNGRNPTSLNELMNKKIMLPAKIGSDAYTGSIFDRKYLMANAVDKQGNLVDAFGNNFLYDPLRGEVRASTKGCETW
jgi:type II secretory pathway pseudopilin PulG